MSPSAMSPPRSRTTSSYSRRASASPVPFVPQAESLILPDGAVGEEAAELLSEFVHHHHEDTLVAAETQDHDHSHHETKHLPWWKRPSALWLLGILPFASIAMSGTMAPRVEIYTMLACSVYKPDIFKQTFPPIENVGYIELPSPHTMLDGGPLSMTVTLESKNGTVPNLCASDPVVQAAVAKLTAVMSACMGILSCLTTGWWGSFSDRYGRTRVMGISVIGLLLTDFNFIFVTLFFRRLPGGYWFLIVGPLVEGSLGGMTSAIAAIHAYLADTTTDGTRSRTFSLSLGLMFTGMAIGPSLGGLLIRFTGKVLSVFYAAGSLHLAYAFLVWFIIPESLSSRRMQQSHAKYDGELRDAARDREVNPAVGVFVRIKRLFSFLSPLTVFIPEVEGRGRNPLKKRRRDWNLTLVAAGYGFTISVMGSYTYKFQYAASAFGWTSEIIGYWLSLIGAARAIFLTIILPVAISILKPKPIIIDIPITPTTSEEQPLLARNPSPASRGGRPQPTPSPPPRPQTTQKEIHSPAFDLGLARTSLFIDVAAYALMALVPTGLAFTLSSMLGAMGVGFSPAIQTVALALYTRRGGTETGRLFGALSVVQALCSQILGPAIYGLVYMKTVASFPRAIFVVIMGNMAISLVLISLIRLPKDGRGETGIMGEEEEIDAFGGSVEPLTGVDDGGDGGDSGQGGKSRPPPIITVTSSSG